jgi:hypothetical protein
MEPEAEKQRPNTEDTSSTTDVDASIKEARIYSDNDDEGRDEVEWMDPGHQEDLERQSTRRVRSPCSILLV